ncbi:MAG: hypothetical protein JXJ22_15915 [Bacteroidales bacterium]|nr:hypothetical protein [Bacteroidales bacterium]
MNNFLLKLSRENNTLNFLLHRTNKKNEILEGKNTLYHDFLQCREYRYKSTLIVVLGDIFSLEPGALYQLVESENKFEILQNLKGLSYIISINEPDGRVDVYNPLFGMLPVYYYESKDSVIISDSIDLFVHLKDIDVQLSLNKKYVLEQFLFFYPIVSSSLFNEIRLVPANSFLSVFNSGIEIKKYFFIEDYFSENPKKWRKSLPGISTIFLKNLKFYFPESPHWIAFTGGFDGRTLVSSAIAANQNFSAYAFGTPANDDVNIPLKNSQELGIPFTPLYLNENSYIHNYYELGREVSILSGGELSHIYNHFLYAAKELGKSYNTMLTGYCGSEVLRAPHSTGAVLSSATKEFLFYENQKNWENLIRDRFYQLSYIHHDYFKPDLEELIRELIEYRENRFKVKKLKPNQKLYIFIFEEAFRKFFGNWIKVQRPFIRVRIPYLDAEFIRELLKTELAGVNNKFYTKNPVYRFKGQALYAHIIKKTNATLYRLKTGKGYRPKDLIRLSGYLVLIVKYIRKKIVRKITTPNLDNLSILTGIYENLEKYPLEKFEEMYKVKELRQYLRDFKNVSNESQRDEAVMALSQVTYLKYLKEKNIL